MSIPLVMSAAGPVPTSPATLRQNLLDLVSSTNPDYTANLPGTLIEDIASTCVGALSTIDSARVEAVNAITPYGANAFVLSQQGAQAGIVQGAATNTSVDVVISGPAGYVIPSGFVVSDGSHQYVIQDGGVILSAGSTNQLFAVSNDTGSWAVPAGTVTQIVTSVPSSISLTVTNPQAGTASTGAESVQDYRARVLQSQTAAAQGVPTFLKTLLQNIPGVTPRLVSVLQVSGGWEVICGGGDAYAVANAIYQACVDLSSVVGSSTPSRNVTATITDGYDSYTITSVNPPQQVVTLAATWNTTLPNFTAGSQVNQLAAPAMQAYINSIGVGQPINLLELTATFQTAVASVLPALNLTTLTFAVTINGSSALPTAGTSIIPSDPESYFYASASAVTSVQG